MPFSLLFILCCVYMYVFVTVGYKTVNRFITFYSSVALCYMCLINLRIYLFDCSFYYSVVHGAIKVFKG